MNVAEFYDCYDIDIPRFSIIVSCILDKTMTLYKIIILLQDWFRIGWTTKLTIGRHVFLLVDSIYDKSEFQRNKSHFS